MMCDVEQQTSMPRYLWAWLAAPLLIFPWIITLRIFPMIAPNEEPKWGLLVACGVWLAVAGAYALWQRKSMDVRWTWAGLALAGFYVLLWIGVWLGPNTTEGWIRFAFWLASLAVFLTVVWGWRHMPRFQEAWAWSISVGSFVFSALYWKGYVLDYGTPNYNFSVLFSPIGHVNFTGDALILLLPALIYLLLMNTHALLRLLNWCSVMTVLTILLVASSRGALGGVILGALVFTLLALRHQAYIRSLPWRSMRYGLPAVLLLSSLLTSWVVYELLPYHYRDLARVSASVGQTVNGKVMKPLTPNVPQPPLAEMWHDLSPVIGMDRATMYGAATGMVMDAPWLGHGTGNFFTVYPAFSNHYPDFRDALSSARTFTTNPHNIVFQIATQQGIPAALLFMGLLLLFFGRVLWSVWKQWNIWLALGGMGLTAALFDAMFNHVFFNPASMFVFALVGGAWWGGLSVMRAIGRIHIQRPVLRPLAASLVLAAILLSVWPTRWLISEWYAGSAMSHMRQVAVANVEYQKAYAWDKDNFRAIFGVAQAAYQQKNYPQAIVYLKHFEAVYPYNPPALNLLGAAYMMHGDYAEAAAAFQRTVDILPDFKMAQQNLARSKAILNNMGRSTHE